MEPSNSVLDLSFENLNHGDDYILDNMHSILPAVQKCCEHAKDDVAVLRAIEIALGPGIVSFSTSELEDKLFTFACPASIRMFAKTLHGIENFEKDQSYTQTDISDLLGNLLNVCFEIITNLQNALVHLGSESQIEICSIQSVAICSAEIIHQAYSHCRKSEEVYGTYFNKLSENLAAFLRKTRDLQTQLLLLLNEHILFKCELAEDLVILDEIMSSLFKAGISIINLDVKTMADLWRGCLALTGKYSEHLKVQHNIAEPLTYLCESIVKDMESVLQQESLDMKTFVTRVKICSFILKIIIKLCEQFSGYLGDCHHSLIHLLIKLSKYNQPYLEFIKFPPDAVVELTKQVTIGADPLLSQLLNDRGLVSSFANRISSEDSYGCLFLCCTVTKKLIHCDSETRKLWISPDFNVVNCIFLSLSECNYELCSDIKIPSVLIPGKTKRPTDLYEHVCTSTASFIMTLTPKEFSDVEKILLQNVLQTNPWCAILAIDVWCLLARFADGDLCFSQLKIITKLLLQFSSESMSPENLYLSSLAQRLLPLLSQKHKDSFMEMFPFKDNPYLWQTLGTHHLSEKQRCFVESQISQTADSLNKMLFSDRQNSSHIDLKLPRLSEDFQTIRLDSNERFIEDVAKLWKIQLTDIESNTFQRRYLEAASCITAPVLPDLTPHDLLIILQRIKRLLSSTQDSTVRLSIAAIIRRLATITIPTCPDYKAIARSIAALFFQLLTSECPLVRQRAFELFSYFACVTKHPNIVALSVGNNCTLQAEITDYLQKKLRHNDNADEFLNKLSRVKYEHTCCEFLDTNNDEVVEPSFKKPRLSDDSDAQIIIDRLKEITNQVMQCRDRFSVDQRRQLKDIKERLSSLT